jgi:hypothetical protein
MLLEDTMADKNNSDKIVEEVCTCECHWQGEDHFCKQPIPCCHATGEKYIKDGYVDWVKYKEVQDRLKNPTKKSS